jgi:hypothetical protein
MAQRLQHALRKRIMQPQRQAAALIVLSMFVAVFIGALYLSQSSASSNLGRQLNDLILERDTLQQANEQLRAEIAGYRTVERLLRRAQEMGYAQAGSAEMEFLVVDGYNPNRDEAVIPLEDNAVPLPEYDESFTGWVQQQWDALVRQFEAFNQTGDTP